MRIAPPPLFSPPAQPAATEPEFTPSPLAVGISTRFIQQDAIELARQIVAKIDTPVQLAAAMGLSEIQWLVLEHSEAFQQIMVLARTEASSAAGLADQVRLKALLALNNGGVLDMVAIMSDPKAAPGVRNKAFDSLADVAGITKQKDQQASQAGAGPLVVINMPAGGVPVAIGTGRVIDHD